MAKSGKASSRKPTPKAKSTGKASTKSKAIKKSPAKASPAKSGSPSKVKWAAPYEKKIQMFKTQGDYFARNAKYASM